MKTILLLISVFLSPNKNTIPANNEPAHEVYNNYLVCHIMQTARPYIGTPYKFGGVNRKYGMDCSAFVREVFQELGFTLPRTSQEMSSIGRRIELKNLLPGDLLFFHSSKNSEICHVGLVTDANNFDKVLFLHCSTDRKSVQEDNLYSKRYKSIFVKAMRPF